VNWREEFEFWHDLKIDGPKWKKWIRLVYWFIFISLYLLLMIICFIAAHEAMNLGL